MMATLRVHRMRPDAKVPRYESSGAAGLDLAACLDEPLTLEPGGTARVPTGLRISLPAGHEGQVRPRSGLAAKHAVTVLNAPGTIDEDYRGEVQVILINHGSEPFTIENGDRVAQLVVAPVRQAEIHVVESEAELGDTERGDAGFGSTGK
ncbi:MAG: dUTP diphosphatase [Myxococcota bacterium]